MARKLCFSLALSSLLTLSQCQFTLSPGVVNTTTGPVRGITKKTVWNSIDYHAFFAIPYAKPPLGELRFKPPVPIEPWTAPYDASKENAGCPQIGLYSKVYMGVEDCLYLNVFTRGYGNGTEPKPVMVWIYGGAYVAGHSRTTLYGPDFFLEEDVVFVSFNYRIGALGFLAMGHQDAMGNAGLKDQNLALRWVKDNIANFGGDPNQITAFGESAGAASVGFHLLCPKSKGLFNQAILQSGTPITQWSFHTPDKARRSAFELGRKLGYRGHDEKGLIEFLRDVPVHKIVGSSTTVQLGLLPFRPTIEDPSTAPDGNTFMTQCPVGQLQSGNFTKVPLILGYTKDEALFFLDLFAGKPAELSPISRFIREDTSIAGVIGSLLAQVAAMLLQITPKFLLEAGIQLVTNVFFVAPIDLTQRFLSKSNDDNPIYYYRLSYESEYNLHDVEGQSVNGTGHTDDLAYLFDVKFIYAPTDPDHPFNVFRKKFVNLWVNFAKTGDPSPPEPRNSSVFDVTWVDSTNTGMQLEINTEAEMRPRQVDTTVLGYEASLYAELPFTTGCHRALAPPTIF